MDRTSASGAEDAGSIPTGGTNFSIILIIFNWLIYLGLLGPLADDVGIRAEGTPKL